MQATAAMPTAATETATREELARILAPVAVEEFLQQDLGKRFRHIPGDPGKFAALLPWDVLNRILEQHRLETPRLRLTREGKPVSPDSFLSYTSNTRNTSRIPRLNATALTAQLRSGATLVLDAVDELHEPIRAIADSLERVFRMRVQVNAYAGWRTSHGFDLHWDDHDVFVLQVSARTRSSRPRFGQPAVSRQAGSSLPRHRRRRRSRRGRCSAARSRD